MTAALLLGAALLLPSPVMAQQAGSFATPDAPVSAAPAQAPSDAEAPHEDAAEESLAGRVIIEGKTYLLDDDGRKIAGNCWAPWDGQNYFVNADGVVYQNMFLHFGDTTYYVDETGAQARGHREIAGNLYYFWEEGERAGQMVKGNQFVHTPYGWMFPQADGALYHDQFISFGPHIRYYMGSDGVLQEGLVPANGTVYRMTGEAGKLLQQSSSYEYEGKWYFAKPDGEPYRNQIITFGQTCYFMGADGARVDGPFKWNGEEYIADVAAGTVDKVFTADFLWPVAGRTEISSSFGPRWGSFHYGIDIPAPLGTPVRAARDGVVVERGYSSSAGNYLVVKHENGYFTKYYHLSAFVAAAGQHVAMGETIGAMGSTGRSTGSHLHFEVRSGAPFGRVYDPETFTYAY